MATTSPATPAIAGRQFRSTAARQGASCKTDSVALPGGTLTFLFTDMVDSTSLWEWSSEVMVEIVPRVETTISGCVTSEGGQVFKTIGDAVCAVFSDAPAAARAAVLAQEALGAIVWQPTPLPISVRMGLHSGVAQRHGDSDYLGPTLNRVARIVDSGHGGQILMSEVTQLLLGPAPNLGIEDLGVHHLRGLAQPDRLFQLSYAGGPASHLPPRSALRVTAGNLDAVRPPIVGRDEAVSEVGQLLSTARIVCIAGPGGVGKTTVAIEAASSVAAPDGVWLIELGPLATGNAIESTIASVLGISVDGDRSTLDAVVETLSSRRSVLVLDNAEHVLASAREVVGQIAAKSPDLRILVTSREPLGLPSERVYRLRPLKVDGREGERSQAAELLARTIIKQGGDLDDLPSTEKHMEMVARTLDGLPLAIELAAGRAATLGLAEVARRLLSELSVLSAPELGHDRHGALSTSIGWSVDLLSPDEQELFARLSVFAGGFTIGAAEAIVADWQPSTSVLNAVDRLIRASLVESETTEAGERRFRMLEPIRKVAEEELGRSDQRSDLRLAHGYHYLGVAAELAVPLRLGRPEAHRALALEFANLRRAHQTGLEVGDISLALELPAAFGRTPYEAGLSEIFEWLDAAIDSEFAADSPSYPRALALAAEGAGGRGDRTRATELLLRLDDLANSGAELDPSVRGALDLAYFYDGRVPVDAIEAIPEPPNPMDAADLHQTLAMVHLYQLQDKDRARHHADLVGTYGQGTPIEGWHGYLEAELSQDDDPARAASLYRAAADHALASSYVLLGGVSRVGLASALRRIGDIRSASQVLAELIREWQLRGNWLHQWTALRNAVEVLADAGKSELAPQLHAATCQAPSSPDTFGAQGERLEALFGPEAELPASTMTEHEIVSTTIDALRGLIDSAD